MYLIDILNKKEYFKKYNLKKGYLVFNTRDFLLDNLENKEFFKLLKKNEKYLSTDFYDVFILIEKIIKNYSMSLFQNYQREWLNLWDTIHKDNFNYYDIRNFWILKLDNKKIINQIKKIQPFRKRNSYSFVVKKKHNYLWQINLNNNTGYKQNVNDIRSRNRIFKSAPDFLNTNKLLHTVISSISQIIYEYLNHTTDKFQIIMHNMKTYAYKNVSNKPAPEGIHQDGVDFIVSAIVTDKINILGGVSKVYDSSPNHNNSNLILKKQLGKGEGILQSDNYDDFWHDITPIKRKNNSKIGFRVILGFDINICYEK